MQRAPDDQQQKNHGQGGQHHQVALAGTSYIGQLPNFTQDLERGTNAEHASTTSASLPALHPNPSEIFLQSQPPNRTGSPPRTTQPDEFEWGPSHPCFPHLNPHVPITSSAFASTRIIRIRRDWLISGDLAPTFSNLYPEILASYISENLFREIIGELNRRLIKIFCPWSYYNWLDATMGVFTLWIWEDLGLGLAKRKLAALEAWINEFNTMWGETDGVSIIPPRKTAFMTVSDTNFTRGALSLFSHAFRIVKPIAK